MNVIMSHVDSGDTNNSWVEPTVVQTPIPTPGSTPVATPTAKPTWNDAPYSYWGGAVTGDRIYIP